MLVKYTGKYVKIYFIMKITFLGFKEFFNFLFCTLRKGLYLEYFE